VEVLWLRIIAVASKLDAYYRSLLCVWCSNVRSSWTCSTSHWWDVKLKLLYLYVALLSFTIFALRPHVVQNMWQCVT